MAEPLRFGRYTVIRVLGRGRLGVVYHAADSEKSRDVALKVIKAPPTSTQSDVSHLQQCLDRDFRAAGLLSHPNIAEVYGVGQQRDNVYVAMELVAGESLEHEFGAGVELALAQVAQLAQEVGSALTYAHAQGEVHRDVTPGNILVSDDGRFRLTDFGVAAFYERTLGRGRSALGHPAFTAPELISGAPTTPASDQFSLGAVVYRALTGDRPFTGERTATVLYQVTQLDPPPPSSLEPRVPEAVSLAVMRSLDKDPTQRYPGCQDFAAAVMVGLSEDRGGTDTAPATHDSATWAWPIPVATAPVESVAPIHAPAGEVEGEPDAQPSAVDWQDTALHDAELHDGSVHHAAGLESLPPPAPVSPPIAPPLPARRRQTRVLAGLAAVFAVALGAGIFWLNPFGVFGPPWVEAVVAVDSEPPGQDLAVWLAGRPLGVTTPTEVPVEGEEGVALRLDLVREDAVVASTVLVLGAGLSPRWVPEVAVPILPIRYEIVSQPVGARVRLDGQSIARPTPVDVDLFPGQAYHIEVALDGYETLTRTVDPALLDTEDSSLMFALTRIIAPARVEASADVPLILVATLADDGTEHRAEGQSASLELPPGEYSVMVTAPEIFFSGATDVTLDEGQGVRLPDLPAAVRILVFDVPGNATIQIDDFEPFPSGGPRLVAVGQHRFTFEWPSGARLERTVQVENDDQEVSAREPSS